MTLFSRRKDEESLLVTETNVSFEHGGGDWLLNKL